MKNLIYLLLLVGIASCTRKLDLLIFDGSKADGTLTLGVEYGANFWGAAGSPKIKQEEARQRAVQKCREWGYSDAEIFEAGVVDCIAMNNNTCIKYRYLIKCQCTD